MPTLAQQAAACIDLMAESGKDKNIFTTQDHAGGIYVRNEDCWAVTTDLSCFSPWNSYGGITRAGTLISPRHIIFANHYPIPNGSTIRFVTTGNIVEERTIEAQISLSPQADFVIARLSSDITNCTFARVLPTNWQEFIAVHPINFPVIRCDYEKKALTGNLQMMTVNQASCAGYPPTQGYRSEYWENIISGDSGSPCFLVFDATPIILTVWTNGEGGMGNQIASFREQIDAAMTTLGGGYTTAAATLTADPQPPPEPEPVIIVVYPYPEIIMGSLLYLHDTTDGVGHWHTHITDPSPQAPVSGDTLDINGKAVTAATYIASLATVTLVDGVGGGRCTFDSAFANDVIVEGAIVRLVEGANGSSASSITLNSGVLGMDGGSMSGSTVCNGGTLTEIDSIAGTQVYGTLVLAAGVTVTTPTFIPLGLVSITGGTRSLAITLNCETVVSGGTITLTATTNRGSIKCTGGTLAITGSTYGVVSATNGGAITYTGTAKNYGLAACEGGAITFATGTKNYAVVACRDGLMTFATGSANTKLIVVESDGTLVVEDIDNELSLHTGDTIIYQNGTADGWITNLRSMISEQKTTHYTGTIADKITVLDDANANKLYRKGGASMTDCLAANILATKTIAEVAGTLDIAADNPPLSPLRLLN